MSRKLSKFVALLLAALMLAAALPAFAATYAWAKKDTPLRVWGDNNADVILTLAKGEAVTVESSDVDQSGNEWLKVNCSGQYGWVARNDMTYENPGSASGSSSGSSSSGSSSAPQSSGGGFTMYIYTDTGARVNVRASMSTSSEILGTMEYGHEVFVTNWYSSVGWAEVLYGSYGSGYVQTRFLTSSKPASKTATPTTAPTANPTADPNAQAAAEAAAAAQAAVELGVEQATLVAYTTPVTIMVRTARASGWVNFRTGPSTATSIVTTYPDGKELQAIGETTNWYQAQDTQSGKVGYISKKYSVIVPSAAATIEQKDDGTETLGKLDVNGAFTIECKLPADYSLNVVNVMGSKIVASLTTNTALKPVMYLSIAYDDQYAEIERMNDMTDEQLSLLEASFVDMGSVSISYGETSEGTKLLIARQAGNDADFVDILTVYKGYSIEFVMSPNPAAAAGVRLTDEQVQMCIDFLSDMQFVAAE